MCILYLTAANGCAPAIGQTLTNILLINRADDGTIQIYKPVTMSSLSRRACYKCGNVGHYAEVCSSAERLCYNCKQPGMIASIPVSLEDAPLTVTTQDTNQTSALCRALPRPSSAITARDLATFRLTARPCA
jgi:hypothetical protein